MKKNLLMILINLSILLCSCSAQEDKLKNIPYIEIDKSKIYLRYSTQEDVEKILGNPSAKEYFKNGLEDFNWNDFTVFFYEDNKLSFHFNNKNEVIRITINNQYSKKVKIPIGYLTEVTSKIIIKDLEKSGDKSAYASIDFISYSAKDSEFNSILYSYWIDEALKIKWFDVYYENEWE